MFTASLNRHAARRLSIAMTAVGGIGLAGAGALGVGGEGRLPERPETNVGPGTQPPPEEAAAPRQLQSPDEFALSVSEGLAFAYDWGEGESLASADESSGARGDGSGEVADGGAGGQIRYLGSIIGPDRRLAILSVNGKQRILAEGSQGEGISLVRVFDERVVVRDRAGTRDINKAPPGSDLVTVIAAKPGAVEQTPAETPSAEEDEAMNMDRIRNERMEQRARDRAGAQRGALDARMEAIQRNATVIEDGRVIAPGTTSGATSGTAAGTQSTPPRDPRGGGDS